MWNNILPLCFQARRNYGIEQQRRPWPGVVETRADFTIRYIRNGRLKKIVLIENKRASDESSEPAWKDAVQQVTEYMKVARASQFTDPSAVETMYAIVTVGRYSRFYELKPTRQILEDYGGIGGGLFEFKEDEEEIDRLLLELVCKTAH